MCHIALVIFHAIFQCNVVRMGVITQYPVVEWAAFYFFCREDAVCFVHALVVVASSQSAG